MPTDYSFVTQSKYYSPVFNAALFDGPLRLYFAQQHESEALKIYFQIQETLGAPELRRVLKEKSLCLFVMIYPTKESFDIIFGEDSDHFYSSTQLDHSPLIGLRGPLSEIELEEASDLIEEKLVALLKQFRPVNSSLVAGV